MGVGGRMTVRRGTERGGSRGEEREFMYQSTFNRSLLRTDCGNTYDEVSGQGWSLLKFIAIKGIHVESVFMKNRSFFSLQRKTLFFHYISNVSIFGMRFQPKNYFHFSSSLCSYTEGNCYCVLIPFVLIVIRIIS